MDNHGPDNPDAIRLGSDERNRRRAEVRNVVFMSIPVVITFSSRAFMDIADYVMITGLGSGDAQAAIFEANPRMMEDALRPIPQERQDIILEDLDRMQEVLDDIEADELSNAEKLERKKRALIDGGYMGPTEAFSVGLARFQEARQEARSMAGTFLKPLSAEPGAGPAEASGLGGNEPRQSISSAQIPAAAALIEDLNFTERNEELDRVFPGMTQADRAAVHRAAGPAPVISGEPGSEVGAIPGEEPDTTGGRQGTRGRRR